ncbi:MAG: hypothetical protein AB7H97_00710 [Pseudobdellovibrionaceae bacterium]
MHRRIILILALTLISNQSFAHSLYPPIIDIARLIVKAEDGIDVSYNNKSKHVSNWSEAFGFLGDSIGDDFHQSLELQGYKNPIQEGEQ